jgi:hypothetical protein
LNVGRDIVFKGRKEETMGRTRRLQRWKMQTEPLISHFLIYSFLKYMMPYVVFVDSDLSLMMILCENLCSGPLVDFRRDLASCDILFLDPGFSFWISIFFLLYF